MFDAVLTEQRPVVYRILRYYTEGGAGADP